MRGADGGEVLVPTALAVLDLLRLVQDEVGELELLEDAPLCLGLVAVLLPQLKGAQHDVEAAAEDISAHLGTLRLAAVVLEHLS